MVGHTRYARSRLICAVLFEPQDTSCLQRFGPKMGINGAGAKRCGPLAARGQLTGSTSTQKLVARPSAVLGDAKRRRDQRYGPLRPPAGPAVRRRGRANVPANQVVSSNQDLRHLAPDAHATLSRARFERATACSRWLVVDYSVRHRRARQVR